MSDSETTTDVAALTVQLLSAYLSNNTVASEDLAGLIKTTRAALVDDVEAVAPEPEAATYTPAVSVRKSLASNDYIVSLIDGKSYKTLKRHLRTHGLTPETYRERYKLPASYPMVAPSFAAHRRAIAEKIGLGNRRRVAPDAAQDAPVAAPVTAAPAEAAPVAAKPKKAAAGKPKVAAKPVAETASAKAPATKAPAAKANPAAKAAPAKVATAETPAVKKAKPAAPSDGTPAPKRRPRMARDPKPAA